MKKVFLILGFAVLLFSCSKNSEQIEATKKELLSFKITEKELSKYQFDVVETFDTDIYQMIIQYHKNKADEFNQFPEIQMQELKKVSEYSNLKAKANGAKLYYRVHAYRIAGDTLNNKFFFLDDKNNLIDFINKK